MNIKNLWRKEVAKKNLDSLDGILDTPHIEIISSPKDWNHQDLWWYDKEGECSNCHTRIRFKKNAHVDRDFIPWHFDWERKIESVGYLCPTCKNPITISSG